MTKLRLYLIIINALACLLMYIDKKKARYQLRRIPEKALLAVALLGGSLGGICGMWLFHHKTRKPVFVFGLPIMLILQIWMYF